MRGGVQILSSFMSMKFNLANLTSSTLAARSDTFRAHRLLGALVAGSLMAAAPLAGCQRNRDFNLNPASSASLQEALKLATEGEALRKDAKFAKAAEKYKQSIAIKPDIGAVWVNYGACLSELGDYMPARDAYIRAAELLPSDPRPYENLGLLYHDRGYDVKALEYYELSLAKDPHWLSSLRGAIISAKNLRVASEKGQQFINDGIMLEKDPQFLRVMQNERFRVEAKLKEQSSGKGF